METNNVNVNNNTDVKEEEYKPSDLVEDWRFRYDNRWCTEFNLKMLLALDIISERDLEYIKTGH